MAAARYRTKLDGVASAIGNTPLVQLHRITEKDSAEVLVKLEFLNPSGSIKDRSALAAVLDAESTNSLAPGGTIVEASSGNMGPALALIGAARGYHVTITMPADVPEESRRRILAYGGNIVQSSSVDGMSGALVAAKRVTEETTGSFFVDQFSNPACVRAHLEGTGRELVEALGKRVNAFVAGVGTGATLMGVGEALRTPGDDCRLVAVEPERSPMLSSGTAGVHRIPGIGADFMPPLLNIKSIDRVMTVSDERAYDTASKLALEEGIFAGPSSGANVAIALQVAQELGPGKTVVTVLPDSGVRYFRPHQ